MRRPVEYAGGEQTIRYKFSCIFRQLLHPLAAVEVPRAARKRRTPESWQGRPGSQTKRIRAAENNPIAREPIRKALRGGESRMVNLANGN